jgi:hypothetical protein
MSLSLAEPPVPMTLRLCRSLVWTQAMFSTLAGLFVVLTAVLFGEGNSIPFAGGTLAGTGAALLGGVYVGVGAVLVGLGFAIGRLAPWARAALVGAEVFLSVLLVLRSLDLSSSTLVNVAFFAAIIGLLFAPGSRVALRGPRSTAAAAAAASPPPG